MNREGRRRGTVQSYCSLPSPRKPRPGFRIVNRFDSPPSASLFIKVSPKPTNHSKFTGKCARPKWSKCHTNPATKSKAKAKGTQKMRLSDAGSSYSLMPWRAVGLRPVSKFAGFSATAILDQLDSDYDGEGDCVDEIHEE
ncbi:unnamed protein product [Thlaspi arvense]|uniref:Uncharacterized protein n=1 Tax=Thlaspi arvense TaxID=13288 RepID=A0AAU9RTL1_THLAR|nr:unnamed protein product [Thlaspi arvense]